MLFSRIQERSVALLTALAVLSAAGSPKAEEQVATLEQARQLSEEIDGIIFYVTEDLEDLASGEAWLLDDKYGRNATVIISSQAEDGFATIFIAG